MYLMSRFVNFGLWVSSWEVASMYHQRLLSFLFFRRIGVGRAYAVLNRKSEEMDTSRFQQ